MCSRIGRSPIGTSGFGKIVVYGRSRVPSPPAKITALILELKATFDTMAGPFPPVLSCLDARATGSA